MLEPGTVELLQTAAQLASGEPTDYGLGWFVRRVPLNDTEARVIGGGTAAAFAGYERGPLAGADGGSVRRLRMSAMRRA